ncbi:MBL fold metallo-hydrolase [Pantoea sp.]|uniref:MBL fold metallo-hydrolase n=1 Tax=Pantoea sp. TaxID=69393 RepID=UPI00290825F6|nr:MBL fold metallo-hydrolase [Pantoea sp.]MDU4129616.1 MBL fold metallo-hydrolase [Pantoea sp.]
MAFMLRNAQELANELFETRVPAQALAIWSLGQAGLIIKNQAGDMLAIDPYLSDAIERNDPETEFVRNFPPVLPPQALSVCDAVLISHFHDDHMDLATLEPLALAAPDLPVWLPAPDIHRLPISNRRPAKTGQRFEIGSFSVLPIAAAHSEYEHDEAGNDRYLGYLISTDGISLWHSGDTLVTPQLRAQMQQLQPTINVLPINGGDSARVARGIMPNMSFRDAADLHHALGSELLLPCHYDLFSCNRDNPAWFVDDMLTRYPGKKFHLLMPGERFIYLS